MTSFDFLVIAILALSIAFAVIRGALREIGTLAALGAAAGAAFLLVAPLQSLFGAGASFIATLMIAGLLGLVAFGAFYFFLHVGLKRVTLSARATRTDRIAGGVFGLARGLVLIGLGFLAYGYYLDEDRRPDAVKNALTLPVAKAMADFFEDLAPAGTRLTPEAPEKAEPATNAAVEGYLRSDRSALADIVTTVTTRDDRRADDEDTDHQPTDDPIAALLKESEPE
ncbi:MAG: CvpA family protein [Parvularculaceae bacterium]